MSGRGSEELLVGGGACCYAYLCSVAPEGLAFLASFRPELLFPPTPHCTCPLEWSTDATRYERRRYAPVVSRRRGRVQAVSHNVVLALIALVFFVFSGGVLPDTRALLL